MIRILGVMTGTSCDGLDAACLAFDRDGWEPLWSARAPYPASLRKKILEIQTPGAKISLKELYAINAELGRWYGSSLRKIISRQNKKPHVIANHGQTVGHFPEKSGNGTTVQLGDPSRIAFETGLTIISHFRDGDMAAGGQGAPLAPRFHELLAAALAKPGEGIAIHNIGGISNFTYVAPGSKIEPIAFDTGPGNIWIDLAAGLATHGKLKMDRGGKLASQGLIDVEAVMKVLKHPYFRKSAPKSTGRDDFPFEALLRSTRARDASLVATATAVTVESIGRAYQNEILHKGLPLDHVFVCGGGAKNPVLMNWISDRLGGIPVTDFSKTGFDSQLIEAQAFAVFGYLSLLGLPLGGAWTGANARAGFASPGMITPGANWNEVLASIASKRR